MGHLQKLQEEYRSKGLVLLGLNASDDRKIALKFLAEKGATFTNIVDASPEAQKLVFENYRGTGVPLSYIIDPEGKIVDAWYGYEKDHARLMRALEKLGVK